MPAALKSAGIGSGFSGAKPSLCESFISTTIIYSAVGSGSGSAG
jgi:hypothetical protein